MTGGFVVTGTGNRFSFGVSRRVLLAAACALGLILAGALVAFYQVILPIITPLEVMTGDLRVAVPPFGRLDDRGAQAWGRGNDMAAGFAERLDQHRQAITQSMPPGPVPIVRPT
jgi:hypothetical protein